MGSNKINILINQFFLTKEVSTLFVGLNLVQQNIQKIPQQTLILWPNIKHPACSHEQARWATDQWEPLRWSDIFS